MKITDFFDKIYCINLSKRKDRWNTVFERLKRVGIEPARWEAIDGDILNWISKEGKNYIGCALSHLSAMIDAKYNNYNRILILEDDVCPFKDFDFIFKHFLNQQQKVDWGFFYLGFTPLNDDWSKWDYKVLQNNFVSKNVVKGIPNLSGAYAYAMQKPFINYFLETFGKNVGINGTYYTVDSWIQLNHYKTESPFKNKIFAFTPQLFAHDNGFSDNTNETNNRLIRSVDTRFFPVSSYII